MLLLLAKLAPLLLWLLTELPTLLLWLLLPLLLRLLAKLAALLQRLPVGVLIGRNLLPRGRILANICILLRRRCGGPRRGCRHRSSHVPRATLLLRPQFSRAAQQGTQNEHNHKETVTKIQTKIQSHNSPSKQLHFFSR